MSKMLKNICIENLIPGNNTSKCNYVKGKLDVNIISKNSKYNEDIDEKCEFNSKILLNNIYEKRKKLRKWILKIYNTCCEKIKLADELGLTDIMFEIPEIILESSEYKHEQAIKYINDNLRKEYLDTYIINYRQIFISWKYIELNKDNHNELNNLTDILN
jgi:hypothetical protein